MNLARSEANAVLSPIRVHILPAFFLGSFWLPARIERRPDRGRGPHQQGDAVVDSHDYDSSIGRQCQTFVMRSSGVAVISRKRSVHDEKSSHSSSGSQLAAMSRHSSSALSPSASTTGSACIRSRSPATFSSESTATSSRRVQGRSMNSNPHPISQSHG